PPQPPAIDIQRSMVVTDPAILDAFNFQRVLQTLTRGTSTTPLALYQQWFDTQNPRPGLAEADAPHCDDFVTNGKPSFNGFPRRCPRRKGSALGSHVSEQTETVDGVTRHTISPALRDVFAPNGAKILSD